MNHSKLKGAIAERGIKRDELCELWGCTPAAASNKVNGKSPISLTQAQSFSEYAHLTDKEKVEIFLT